VNRRQFLAMTGAGLVFGVARESAALPNPGQTLPDFTLTLLDGKKVSLKELRGKPVLLNFWHSG
jgi:cytochrome oxidase Cu insertion factor (SCO1/SenC/PrrC family)